ncbi:MAG: hypothetical protein K2H22_03880, partial [Muribaculaceae bacterium]|nr:hypothetical protein [Muribaculaceae bacterium]
TSNGKAVANNDVIEQSYVKEDYSDLGPDMADYLWNPHLEASSTDGNVSVSVSVTADEKTESLTICWPMQCVMVPAGGTVTANGTLSAEPSDLQIHREIFVTSKEEMPTEVGSAKVKVSSDSETLEFTVKFLLTDGSGVGENIADSNVAAEYYTIQGIRVAEPQKGQIYIERKGSKVTKRIF